MKLIFALLALALGACQSQPRGDANTAVGADSDRLGNAAAPGGSATEPAANTTAPRTESAFPARFAGRWGLVPGDCKEGASDAKGLMKVEGGTLRFYESRGVAERLTIDGDKAWGEFAFTGEGQKWGKTVALTLTDGGKSLVREEDELPTPLRYNKCPA